MTEPSDRNEDEDLDRLIATLSQGTPASAPIGEDERLAARYAIGRLSTLEPLPKALERRLLQSAQRVGAAARPVRRWSIINLIAGGGVPALCASIALVSFMVARLLPPQLQLWPRSLQTAGAATYPWNHGPDAAGANVHGYVAWLPAQNHGYVVFEGLKPNDPRREQYQLWIVDSERDARYPVDGGVFNAPANGQEVRVNVNPPLHVGHPAAFVLTMERPGGVVVSDDARVVAIAKVTGS